MNIDIDWDTIFEIWSEVATAAIGIGVPIIAVIVVALSIGFIVDWLGRKEKND